MMPAWWIGVNFMREQRVVIYIFLVWTAGIGAIFALLIRDATYSDLESLFRQQLVYAIASLVFVSAGAIYNERRSRRILAVLSKGIRRRQYLAGLLIGCGLLAGLYLVSLGLIETLLSLRFSLETHIWPAILAAMLACVLAASIGLFFGGFLHPFVASALSAILIGLPAAVAALFGEQWKLLVPVAYVAERLLKYSFAAGWTEGWAFAVIVTLETMLFWLLASIIFERRDVTMAVE